MSSVEPAKQTPVPDPTKKEWTFLGINRADYVKISLGLFTGAMLCLFAFWVNWRSPHLKVTIPDTIVFKGEKNQLGIVNVTVSNDGSKEAEEVECWVNLAGSKIQEVKASPEHLNAVVTSKDDKVKVDVHLLNPKEDLLISALISNPEKLPEKAKIEVRAKGVIGEREAKTQEIAWLVFLGTAVAVYGIIFIFVTLISVLFPTFVNRFFLRFIDEAAIKEILRRRDALVLEKSRLDVLIKIGEEVKTDLLDEPTKQKALEYIKKYFDDLK